jgi:hypothetical protein
LALIQRAEINYDQTRKIFEMEYHEMKENHRNLVKNKGMTTTLMLLIDRRLTLITDKLRDIAHFRIQYYLRNSFDNSDKVHSMGILPNLINETTFKFTDEQQRLLSRGPAYVPPAQMYSSVLSSSSSTLSMDDVLKKHYAPLQHHLASLFSKHHVNIALSMGVR